MSSPAISALVPRHDFKAVRSRAAFLRRSREHAKPAVNLRQAIWLITMVMSHHPPLLRLSRAAQAALIAGARDNDPVRGLTHGFYKYPARFSPIFARAAIEAFTQPGDLVLDNHVGGGTTLVEALATGRPVAERFLVSPIAMHI